LRASRSYSFAIAAISALISACVEAAASDDAATAMAAPRVR
jgi:hypothetical protein